MSFVSLSLSVVFVLLFYFSYYYFADQELKNQLTQTATLLTQEYFIYAESQIKYLPQSSQVGLADLLKSRDMSGVVYDSKGKRVGTFGIYRLFFEAEPETAKRVKELVETVIQSQQGHYAHLEAVEATYELYTVPIIFDSEVVGYLQLAKQYSILQKMRWLNIWLLVLVIPPALLIIWIITQIILKRFFTPLHGLVRVFSATSVDALPKTIKTRSPFDEVQSLVAACNLMIDRLRDGIERQKHFTAYASHELNTPLTRVTGNIELARKLLIEPKKADGYLHSSLEELETISELLNGLLILVQPQKKLSGFRVTEVEQQLQTVVGEYASQLRDRTVELVVDELASKSLAIHPSHLTMLIVNLLTNAIKYGQDKSTITIKLTTIETVAQLVVENTGEGLSKIEQKRVFSPFFRTKQAKKKEGYGVGLALVRQIASYYGMKVEATTKPGGVVRVQISNIPLA